MNDSPASRAASAATAALLVLVASIGFVVFQATEVEVMRPFLITLGSLAIAVAAIVHLVFIAILARRAGKRALWYVVGALVTLPIGSAVGLVMYEWHTKVDRPSSGPSAA